MFGPVLLFDLGFLGVLPVPLPESLIAPPRPVGGPIGRLRVGGASRKQTDCEYRRQQPDECSPPHISPEIVPRDQIIMEEPECVRFESAAGDHGALTAGMN